MQIKRTPYPWNDKHWEVWQGSAKLGAFWCGGSANGWCYLIGPDPKMGQSVPAGLVDTQAIALWIRARYYAELKAIVEEEIAWRV